MSDSEWKRISFTVDLPSLFQEITRRTDARESPGVITGLNQAQVYLATIAKRAIEINDPVILRALENMGCVNREGSKE